MTLESDAAYRTRLMTHIESMSRTDRQDLPTAIGDRLDEIGIHVSNGRYIHPPSGQRRYLPTLADLVDRLTIVQLKMIFIPDHAEDYARERKDIEHDIDLILKEKDIKLNATGIHAICMLMLTNRFIWENESKARAGGSDQDALLKLTHSINGIRNTAKNVIAAVDSGRKDYKIDALAADLPPEFGNWKVFDV